MDFRKELAKELELGVIAENTMLDDYVKACETIAVRYHESEVKKFRNCVEQELETARQHKKTYGWICNHFKRYYEGRISVCKNLLLFIDKECKD